MKTKKNVVPTTIKSSLWGRSLTGFTLEKNGSKTKIKCDSGSSGSSSSSDSSGSNSSSSSSSKQDYRVELSVRETLA